VTDPARVLVTGGAGNLGGWLVRTAGPDVDLHVTERVTSVPADVAARAAVHRIDVGDAGALARLVAAIAPDVVIHTAYAMDDRAAIVDATHNVAAATAAVDASLVHLSTDVVFAGDAPPYGERDPLDPTTDYGRWKAAAESEAQDLITDVSIVRTSMIVSLDPLDRGTAALVAALRSGTAVTLFTDEMRQPIRAEDLAAEIWDMVMLDRDQRAGVWHLPGPERMDRHALGVRLATRLGLDPSAFAVALAADVAPERPRDPELVAERRRQLSVRLRPVDA